MDKTRSLKVHLPEGVNAVLGQYGDGLAVENGEYVLVTKFESEEAIRAAERQRIAIELEREAEAYEAKVDLACKKGADATAMSHEGARVALQQFAARLKEEG